MANFEERVRERAYYLWQQAGAPEGRAEEFWDEAERHERAAFVAEEGGLPPAGPHARHHLTNEEATPDTGMLPPVGESEDPNSGPSG